MIPATPSVVMAPGSVGWEIVTVVSVLEMIAALLPL